MDITWETIKEDIAISQFLGVDISNTFYNDVLEYYFGNVSKFNEIFNKKNNYQYLYKGSEICTIKFYDSNIYIILYTSFDIYLKTFSTSTYDLYDIITNYFLYKHNIIIEVK